MTDESVDVQKFIDARYSSPVVVSLAKTVFDSIEELHQKRRGSTEGKFKIDLTNAMVYAALLVLFQAIKSNPEFVLECAKRSSVSDTQFKARKAMLRGLYLAFEKKQTK